MPITAAVNYGKGNTEEKHRERESGGFITCCLYVNTPKKQNIFFSIFNLTSFLFTWQCKLS